MNSAGARDWLEKIRQLPTPSHSIRLLNVCGGHERSIAQAGLRSVLPPWLQLIPGPGCPVCVCPEADIALAITIALHEPVIVVAFGDLLRVPISAAAVKQTDLIPNHVRSLLQAKAVGADIRPIASPLEAQQIARDSPGKTVIFFAAGFETTMAPVAALISTFFQAQLPSNLQFVISGRRTWPIVASLLNDNLATPINGMIAPGHVATIMGANEWQFAVQDYQLPTAIAGFSASDLLRAFYAVLAQIQQQHPQLDNSYPAAVTAEGNTIARKKLTQCFNIVDSNWRGIGAIPTSGYQLVPALQSIDAVHTYPGYAAEIDIVFSHNAMPKSCHCADVVMARRLPNHCPLYGTSCTPRQPVGPCMVSDEGACRIWWHAGAEPAR